MTKGNVPGESQGIYAEILNHDVWGAPANALLITLSEPGLMLSSREGLKTAGTICNCYLPESIWPFFDEDAHNWDSYLGEVLGLAGRSPGDTVALSTGVNMGYLDRGEEVYNDLWVQVFVTAGVKTNAMRVGKDRASSLERNGAFEKLGTINTILLTSARLDLAAMAASFITITEAKNIALQELDVRSAYNPEWQATGTGTDQIIIVSGMGEKCRYVGGHTKIGEMMAKGVTSTTIGAIKKGLAE